MTTLSSSSPSSSLSTLLPFTITHQLWMVRLASPAREATLVARYIDFWAL